jgi:hypothetical protein
MKVRLFFYLLLISSIAFGQSDYDEAKERLENLKNGMLLVRLQTSQKQIEALVDRGMEEEGEARRQEQYEENKESILAFSQVFDFCPVYFFYADKSEAIRDKQLAGNIFNSDLVVLQSVSELPEFFLTAEFAETPNLKIDGVVIMDEQMLPLEAPFPFYQREHILLGLISLSKGSMVERLNARMHDLYNMWKHE